MSEIIFLEKTPKTAGALSVRYADIETIPFLPDNIKSHDIAGIRVLIEEYGFVEPIGINRTTGHDIFGNGRLEVLKQMLSDGAKCPKGIIERKVGKRGRGPHTETRKWYAPTIDGLEFDSDQELILAIGMNRTGEKGGIDNVKALAILQRLREQDPENLIRTGYDVDTLERIQTLARFHVKLAEMKNNPSTPDPSVPADTSASRESFVERLNEKWQVKDGDVWKLGSHYLICGDSADLPIAIDEPVRLCFTSPPYDNQRNYEGDTIDFTQLMIGVSKTVFNVLADPGDFIVNLGPISEDSEHKEYWRGWQSYLKQVMGHPVYGFYIWDKLFGFPGNYHGRLSRSHEFLFHFSIGHAQANKWIETSGEAVKRGPRGHQTRQTDSSLKQFDSPALIGQTHKIPDSVIRLYADMTRGIHSQGHPAIFPVELPEFVIKTWSKIGDTVFDPFGGSGTTMIACENLGRKCVMSEISPNYCALILERLTEAFPQLEVKKI